MDLSDALDHLERMQEVVLAETVADLYSELVTVTPVGDASQWNTKYPPKGYIGGSLRAAWKLTRLANNRWKLSNNMEYASIIFDGRKPGSGGWLQGSKQLPAGVDPILLKYNLLLTQRLNRLKV